MYKSNNFLKQIELNIIPRHYFFAHSLKTGTFENFTVNTQGNTAHSQSLN